MTEKSSSKELYACPCCGKLTIAELGSYEICDICGWEDDPVQTSDPEYRGGANRLSLNEARMKWTSCHLKIMRIAHDTN
jgi:hypothetical protein